MAQRVAWPQPEAGKEPDEDPEIDPEGDDGDADDGYANAAPTGEDPRRSRPRRAAASETAEKQAAREGQTVQERMGVRYCNLCCCSLSILFKENSLSNRNELICLSTEPER